MIICTRQRGYWHGLQDLVRDICCVAAERAPECGIGTMIGDLLSADPSSWDAVMIGLRALLCVLLTAPARKAGNPQDQPEVPPSCH